MFKAIFEDEDEEEEEEPEEEANIESSGEESMASPEPEKASLPASSIIQSSIGNISMKDISRYLGKSGEIDSESEEKPNNEPIVGKIMFKKPSAREPVAEADKPKDTTGDVILLDGPKSAVVAGSEVAPDISKFTSLIRSLVAQKGSDTESESDSSSGQSEYEEVSASSKKSKKSRKSKKKKKKHHKKKSKKSHKSDK